MKKMLVFLLYLMICVSLSFSSGSREEKAMAEEAKTVKMWTFLNPEGAKSGRNLALKKIIEDFEKANPNITVVVEPQQWQIMSSKFIAASEAGNAPDICWMLPDQLPDALAAKALADFESLFGEDLTKEEIADVDDVYWSFGNRDGKHYQFGLSRNIIGLVYRKDLFRDKGIEQPVQTWNEFISASKKLTGTDPNTGRKLWAVGMGFGTEKVTPSLAVSAMVAKQKKIFRSDGRANWATPAGIEAMKLMIDMITVHGITPPEAASLSVEDIEQEFDAGKYAMTIIGAVRIPKVRREITATKPEEVSLMLWPGWDESNYSPSVVRGWCVGVWSRSKVSKEAGKFLQAMFSKKADEYWVLDGGQVPVRKSTIDRLPDFFSNPDNEYLKVMSMAISKYGYMQPDSVPTAGWHRDLAGAAQEILVNKKDIETALQEAEARFNERNVK